MGLGIHMFQLSITSDLHRPPWVRGEARQPETKEKENSITHCTERMSLYKHHLREQVEEKTGGGDSQVGA